MAKIESIAKKYWWILVLVFVAAVFFVKTSPWAISPFTATGFGGTYQAGDTYSDSFTLTNRFSKALPELDETDGAITRLYRAVRITDASGAVVAGTEKIEELKTSIATGATISVPMTFSVVDTTPSGDYAAVAILYRLPQAINPSTNQWETGTAALVDNQAKKFTVSTRTAAPTVSINPFSFFTSLFAWIKNILGLG